MEGPQPWSVLKDILNTEEWEEIAGKSQEGDASRKGSAGAGNLQDAATLTVFLRGQLVEE